MEQDFSAYNRDELTTLLSQINKKIKEKEKEKAIAERKLEKQRKSDAKRAIEEVAKTYGLKLADLVGSIASEPQPTPVDKPKRKYTRKSESSVKKSPKAESTSQVKYQHPQMPELTWDGKGKQPDWMMEAFTEGFELHELEYHENA